MTISYLLSILDLYLLKENNNKLLIQVDNEENIVKFSFTYSFDSINQTFVKIDKTIFFTYLGEIVKKITNGLSLEKENMEIKDNKKIYTLDYLNRRIISFIGFSKKELLSIREEFDILSDEFIIPIEDTYDNKLIMNKKLSYSMGFTNYMSLFPSSIFFLDIFIHLVSLFFIVSFSFSSSYNCISSFIFLIL